MTSYNDITSMEKNAVTAVLKLFH